MEREGRTHGRDEGQTAGWMAPEAPRKAPKLEGAAADLARALSLLPRADPQVSRDHLFEDDPRYRALASVTGQILWLAAADGSGLAGMRDWRAFTGQSAAETEGWGWFAAIHPEDQRRVLPLWERSVTTGQAFTVEQRIRRHDGVYRDFTVRVTPILDESGAPRGWAGACTDVTEQKATAAALRASEKRARAVREVLETALAHLTLDELLPRLLDRVREALGADNAVILLPDEAGLLHVRATSGFQAYVDANVTVPLGRGVAGKIAATGEPLIIPDLSEVEVTHLLFQQFLTSLVGVPLRAPNGLRGALHVATAAPRDFTADDVRLLEVVAERIAVAIERAQFHEATAERAIRLEAIIESMTDAVLVCDHDGEIVRFNPAAKQLGLSAMSPDADAPNNAAFYGIVRRVLRGETVTSAQAVEVTITRSNGETVELSLSGAPFWEREGTDAVAPAGGVFVFHDVTERRIAERKTADALGAMLMMVERLVAKDDVENVSWANQTGQRLVEGAATALGSQRVALVAWDERTDLLTSVATTGFSANANDPTWHFPDGQVRLSDFLSDEDIAKLRKDMSIPLDASIIPQQVEPNFGDLMLVPTRIRDQLMGLMVVELDRARAEETITLAQAIARLAALLLERDRLDRERDEARSNARALEVANERLDAFLGMTGHELRIPLTKVKGFIQLTAGRLGPEAKRVAALNGQLDSERLAALSALLEHARAPLAQAESATDLLIRLVDDTLNAEAIRSGALELRLKPCDLVAIARATVEGLHVRFSGREIILEHDGGASVPVLADAQRITQALTNYLTNALNHGPANQPVVVTVSAPVPVAPPVAVEQTDDESDRAMAQVRVRDFGSGLPESERERIWDRFARAETQKRRTGGLGLGLFITRSIVELHGGRTWVENSTGGGCVFAFTLPLYADSGAPQV
jgi:PAS domain S-box-containing protein